MTNDESATPDERLSQAIALAEGFQFLVLEVGGGFDTWALHLLFDDVQARVAELLGAPPLVIIYSRLPARVRQRSNGSDESIEAFISPLLRAPQLDADTRLVAVIDAVRPFGPTSRGARSDESNFRQLLRKLNERRNAIIQSFKGTLVLALPQGHARLLLEEAPDMASVRADIISMPSLKRRVLDPSAVGQLTDAPDALVREAAVRRRLANPSSTEPELDQAVSELHQITSLGSPTTQPPDDSRWGQLRQLLLSMFDTNELMRFAHFAMGREFAEELPPATLPTAELVSHFIEALRRRHVDMPQFFRQLAMDYRPRAQDIATLADHWQAGRERTTSRGITSALSVPELQQQLLTLSPTQLERVFYLARLAGREASLEELRSARERSAPTAREILDWARHDEAERLPRLTEAIEVVSNPRP